ncbi:Lrp/AsnC family transcriptional regulator [Streptomyces sp. QH1-20]|uniref:Lrp/AsnC family transcriptional regulator n=1 Tax=Streptomyces sp. QH1-20 TaxID=3240934 RepID=UPI003512C0A1
MDSSILDEVDQRIVQELRRDGRAPFSQIAHGAGVSEHTVARRFRRLRERGLRVSGQLVPQYVGLTRWLLRLNCTPNASAKIADALARRTDTSWVQIASGGTELNCAVDIRSARERDVLLLEKLPNTPRVVSVSAHCLLHIFGTAPEDTSPAPETPPGSTQALPTPTHPAAEPVELDSVDNKLLSALAHDGRATLPELAEATGRSAAGVSRRLERLRTSGALRFVTDIDPELLGQQMLVRLWLRIAPGALGAVGRALAAHPQIPFAAATTGPSNLVATGHFADAYQLYHYLDHELGTLAGVQAIETAPILRDVKRLTHG